MLARIKHLLSEDSIILASSSAGRKKILEDAGIPCQQVSPKFDESKVDPKSFGNIESYVEELALQKVLSVSKDDDKLFIGFDTVVVLDGAIFGKPASEMEALRTLNKLSGKMHTVYTGLVMIKAQKVLKKFTEKADVYFTELNEDQIKAYISTKEPFGRAGSYAIQGLGGTFVKKIHGDYFAICGIPLHRLTLEVYNLYKDNL